MKMYDILSARVCHVGTKKKRYPFFSSEVKFPTNPPLAVVFIMAEWKYAVEEFVFIIAVVSGSFLQLSGLPNSAEMSVSLRGILHHVFYLARLHIVASWDHNRK
jgi:hypothetical protein